VRRREARSGHRSPAQIPPFEFATSHARSPPQNPSQTLPESRLSDTPAMRHRLARRRQPRAAASANRSAPIHGGRPFSIQGSGSNLTQVKLALPVNQANFAKEPLGF